jgi:hypothetical protein
MEGKNWLILKSVKEELNDMIIIGNNAGDYYLLLIVDL